MPESSSARLDLALQALKRVLSPAVRLALWAGAKHQHVDELLRSVFVEEARAYLREAGSKANASQISVLTGIHRKDLRERLQQPADQLPDTQTSQSARVTARWLRLCLDDPSLARLPFIASGPHWSVARLVRMETGGDTHYKATLIDLARQGIVRIDDTHAEIRTREMGTPHHLPEALSFLADNTRDHLSAATHNVMGLEPRFVERSLFVDHITPASVAKIQSQVKNHWTDLYAQTYAEMASAEQPGQPDATHRIRVGMYVYAEPMPTAEHSQSDPTQARQAST